MPRQSIAIVNYGMGNVRSVQKAIEYIAPNDNVFISDDAKLIADSDRIVFPGQGAMGACMQALKKHGLTDVIKSCAIDRPFLGICLGAQILAKYLGCDVIKNQNDLAEIGFYEIEPTKEGHEIFKNQNIFYQFHTEGFEIPEECQLLARGDIFHNQAFRFQNCYALQFHPEVNFLLHIRWVFLVLIKKPKILFRKGSQNLFYQLYFRFKYNKSVSLWLDSFLDNYLLAQK